MKRVTTVLLLMAVSVLSEGYSQWVFKRRIAVPAPHGVAVTPDGNLWIAPHGQTGDFLGGQALASIRVYQPDGSQAPFSPIQTVTVGLVTDTLFRLDGGARGVSTDHEGNILYSHRDKLFRINYLTGAGMHRIVPIPGKSLTAAAATVSNATPGDVIVGHVLDGNPVSVYDKDYNLKTQVTDSSKQIARTLAVSPNGNTIYFGATTGPGTIVYMSQNGTEGPYAPSDTLFRGMVTESFTWHPVTGKLWTSSRVAGGDAISGVSWSENTWYEVDLVSKTPTDSISWQGGGFDFAGVPRGIAFSTDGDTAYLAGFDGQSVQVFARESAVSVRSGEVVPGGYTLEQNFPNPFNPETVIRFGVAEAGVTRVTVYDILGREVKMLMDEFLTPGIYTVTLNAGDLPSGVYVYELASRNFRSSRKMILAK